MCPYYSRNEGVECVLIIQGIKVSSVLIIQGMKVLSVSLLFKDTVPKSRRLTFIQNVRP